MAKDTRLAVLVIEDEPAVMAFIRMALERSGYAVETAETGTRAVELLRTCSYSGVISDMRTPGGLDGADVWTWIRENRPELAAKMIFVTGDIANGETSATLRRTGVPYLEKPFRVAELISVVNRIFGDASD